MNSQDQYFEYLQARSRWGLLYRTRFLYPRLCRHLSGKVLDVGCGIGDMLRFRSDTIGADVNLRVAEYCRGQGLNAVHMESDELPFEDASFRGLVLDNVLEHIADPTKLLCEIARVLLPGGTFVVGVPGIAGYARDPDHKVFYSEETLVEVVTSHPFACKKIMHMPFRSSFMDAKLRMYAIYGVFTRRT